MGTAVKRLFGWADYQICQFGQGKDGLVGLIGFQTRTAELDIVTHGHSGNQLYRFGKEGRANNGVWFEIVNDGLHHLHFYPDQKTKKPLAEGILHTTSLLQMAGNRARLYAFFIVLMLQKVDEQKAKR
ncbi:MAG: hypothetical protein KJ069_29215 [Anaerolineae bacterium]|nr:hypothetical protein [Anaerolineae bacterium]